MGMATVGLEAMRVDIICSRGLDDSALEVKQPMSILKLQFSARMSDSEVCRPLRYLDNMTLAAL
eukprot:scaffold95470_cov38-Prasinocladus_malaysianus.AAC.1